MTVDEEQHAAFLERLKIARVAVGLSPLIDDERTLRMIAAVVASNTERNRRPNAQPLREPEPGAEQDDGTDRSRGQRRERA